MNTKIKAVIFDRDGVINNNSNHYYVWQPSDFIINEGVFEVMKYFKNQGFYLFIVSNQSGVSKGLYTTKQVNDLHTYFQKQADLHNIKITDFWFCPHHPQNTNCLCRKPESGLLEKAIATYNINTAESFVIGDSERDIESASKAGLKAFLVKPNSNLVTELIKHNFNI